MTDKRPFRFKILGRRLHSKASEEYVDLVVKYQTQELSWSVPIEYRRTGTHLHDASDDEILEFVRKVLAGCHPNNWPSFLKEQEKFWDKKPGASITKSFFDALASDFQWKSVRSDLPENSNPQRRIQDLKEFGFTIATKQMKDRVSGVNSTHHLLLPLARGGVSGYEQWSKEVREKIVSVLGGQDAYEHPGANKHSLLPDHKFPEIRWDETVRRSDLSNLTEDEIRRDFQLISNQRNQQKREACRNCFQTGKRPGLFGIKFYYKGSENWPSEIPNRGFEAREGCIGCGWYDIDAWKVGLNNKLSQGEVDS